MYMLKLETNSRSGISVQNSPKRNTRSKKVLSLQLYSSQVLINEKVRTTKADTKLSIYIAKIQTRPTT